MSDALFRSIGAAGLEHQRRVERDAKAAQDIFDSLFPQQQIAAQDPNDYVATICPRRSGKSWYVAAKALIKCLTKRGARVLIIGLTIDSVTRSFWRILEDLAKRHGLEVEPNKSERTLTFWNGSVIKLFGAETVDRIERIRGDEFDLVIIDEAKSFSPSVLEYLIEDVIDPAVGSRLGQVVMIGTPGHIFAGEFYLATNPGAVRKVAGKDTEQVVARWFDPANPVVEDALWSTHRWTQQDNIKVPGQWERALRLKKKRGWRDDHPTWRREFLGEWVVDEDGLVFALAALRYTDPDRVLWYPDPNRPYGLPEGDWSFLLGIDFGYENPTAFTVAAYSQTRQELRVLHSEKHHRLVLSEVADVYNQLAKRFGGFEAVVCDAGAQGKMIQQTLLSDYGIPAIAAEKRDKQAFIQTLNSDLHSGRVKFIEGDPLCEEMTVLSWDLSNGAKDDLARSNRLREDPKQENDLCDSFLYLWRYSAHRWHEDEPTTGPTPGSRDWFLHREHEAKVQAFEERARRSAEQFEYEYEETIQSALTDILDSLRSRSVMR